MNLNICTRRNIKKYLFKRKHTKVTVWDVMFVVMYCITYVLFMYLLMNRYVLILSVMWFKASDYNFWIFKLKTWSGNQTLTLQKHRQHWVQDITMTRKKNNTELKRWATQATTKSRETTMWYGSVSCSCSTSDTCPITNIIYLVKNCDWG
jgi:hypothetical protein